VAYKLELPPSLAGVHDIIHVSQLKKCLKAPVDVVLLDMTPLEADLTYPEHPVKILDKKDRITRCKTIKFYKVQWSNHTEEEGICNCSLSLLGPSPFKFQVEIYY
jgi:hypothetical protein